MISVLLLLLAQEAEVLPDVKQPALTSTAPADLDSLKPTVTLKELLEAADRLNVDRRITLEQQERAEAELRQAWTALLPGLTVQAGWTHNQFEAEIPAGTFGPDPISLQPKNQLDFVGRIDLPLIDTGRWMRAAAASASAEGAAERARLTSDQLKRAVVAAWYTYAAALAVKVSAERSVALAEAQLKLQEIRMRTGAATELELLRARAEVQRNRQSVADAVRLIAITRRNLETLTGLDPGPAAHLPEVDMRPPPPLAELEKGIDSLPAVRAAAQDLLAVDRLATASRLAFVPRLGGFFTERATNATNFTGEATTYTLGVNLFWQIDVPTFVAIDVQSSNVAIAELALERARLAARDQLNNDWHTLQAALTKVAAAEAQLEASRRARAVATKRYEVGATTQIEVIQADRDLYSAEVQQIQAQSELASTRISLQISAGLPISVN